LLARLITAHDEASGDDTTDQQLRDEVITLIGAGVETSAHALSWTWHLLAQHPDVIHQLQAELDAVIGARSPTLADLPQLPYSRMILDETLRLYPPSAILPRQANAADRIGAYRIPRHAVMMMSQYVTHRHPDFWPEPERFDPSRFDPTQTDVRHRFAYFPFGEGPRVCIGRSLALMEMHIMLATLAQVYTLHEIPGRVVQPELAATLRPRHGLWMTVHERR
jgi:cytochrome P450